MSSNSCVRSAERVLSDDPNWLRTDEDARSLVSRESFLEMAASRTVVVRCAHGSTVYDRRDHRGLARGAKAVWTWLRGSVVLGAPSPAVNGSPVENIGYTPLRNDDHMLSLARAQPLTTGTQNSQRTVAPPSRARGSRCPKCFVVTALRADEANHGLSSMRERPNRRPASVSTARLDSSDPPG
jgi:hypothetical protein